MRLTMLLDVDDAPEAPARAPARETRDTDEGRADHAASAHAEASDLITGFWMAA